MFRPDYTVSHTKHDLASGNYAAFVPNLIQQSLHLAWLQKELAEVKAARLEVEATNQELASALDADLRKRAAELEDALAATDVDAARCAHSAHSQCCGPQTQVHCVNAFLLVRRRAARLETSLATTTSD